MLWLRTLLFVFLIPGTVMGLVPFALNVSNWGPSINIPGVRLFGFPLMLVGLLIIIWCFVDFVRRGRGTPAPYDPPRRLVVSGLYKCVRNPQYIGVILVVLGEAICAGNMLLFGYALFLTVAYDLFVRLYEEPTLRRMFGGEYVRYCAEVSRWMPRCPMHGGSRRD